MMDVPKIKAYYHNGSGIPKPNAIAVTVSGMTFFYSYNTLIAFEDKEGLIISENVWSNTTGRHLNAIEPDNKKRLKHMIFIEEVEKRLSNH